MICVYYKKDNGLDSIDMQDGVKIRDLKVAIFGAGLTRADMTKVRVLLGNTDFNDNDSDIPERTGCLLLMDEVIAIISFSSST